MRYPKRCFLLIILLLAGFAGIGYCQTQTPGLKPEINNYTSFPDFDKPVKKLPSAKNIAINPVGQDVDDLPASDGGDIEILEKRTINSKYYVDKKDPAKFYQLFSYGGNLHYQKKGYWLTISPKLAPAGKTNFIASHQQEPVGFNTGLKNTFIQTLSGRVSFNNWRLFGEKDGTITLLAQANWSHYTAGEDGLKFSNIFPGIDAEMKVLRGSVKTNFIIRANQFPGADRLVFRDHFSAAQNSGALVYTGNLEEHHKAAFKLNNNVCLDIDRAIAYTEKDASKNYQYLDYQITGNNLSFGIDASYINAHLSSGNIIIDPLVSGSGTVAQNAITGSMNCGSYANYCNYKFNVPTPAKATFTGVSFTFGFAAKAPSAENQGFFVIVTGNCQSSWTVVDPPNHGIPGTVTTGNNFLGINSLLSCLPPPSCVSQDVPFELHFYNLYCAGAAGCSDSYVQGIQPLVVKIEGHTLELGSITNPQTICNGSSASLNIGAVYGMPPYTYRWNGGETSSNIIVSPSVTTNYSCTVTDACGVTVTGNTSVVVNPVPVVQSATSTSPLCVGSQLNLSTPLVAGATYSWTGPGGYTSTSRTPVIPNASAAQSGNYSVTITVNDCTSPPVSTTVSITDPVTPAVSINASATTICAGTNVVFTANPVNGGSTPSYQWLLNGKSTGSNSSTYSSNILADNDLVSCVLTTSAGCTTTATAKSNDISVKVNPVTVPSISIKANTAATICAGTLVTFTAAGINGGTTPVYQWQLNGSNVGTNATTYTNNQLNNNDLVTCVLTSNAVCTGTPSATSNTLKFTVIPLVAPAVSITASANGLCQGSPVTFTAEATNGGTSPAYQWTLNGQPVGTNSNTYNSAAFNNGDVVACTLTSSVTCTTTPTASSNTLTVAVSAPVTPAVSIAASATTICAGTNVLFTASPVNGGSAPVFQWKLNGTITGTNTPTYSSSTLNNGDVVTCALTSSLGCTTSQSAVSGGITMIVNPVLTPAVSIVATRASICEGEQITFTASAVNCGNLPHYSWLLNGGSVGTNSSTYASATLRNADVITCKVTPDVIGCYSAADATSNGIAIEVNAVPQVSAGRDTTIFKGSSFALKGFATGNIATYRWEPATYLSATDTRNPVVTPITTTKYTLHAISTASCEATASITVSVLTKIEIPNTFTPNGDGTNDTWVIKGLADYAGATVKVYNRYGQLVFYATTYKQWDGTLDGKPLPAATYYYIINPKNQLPLLSGWITLLR